MKKHLDRAISRVISKEIDSAIDSKRMRWRLTEKIIDRHGEVVLPSGIVLDNYKKNPIVLFGHGWENNGFIPIGKIDIDTIEITENYIDADVIFDSDGHDEFAAMIYDKVKKGFLNTGSIGFRPIEMSYEPVLPEQDGLTYSKWELLEFSIVPIPSNTGATAQKEFAQFRKEVEKKLGEKGISADIFLSTDTVGDLEQIEKTLYDLGLKIDEIKSVVHSIHSLHTSGSPESELDVNSDDESGTCSGVDLSEINHKLQQIINHQKEMQNA